MRSGTVVAIVLGALVIALAGCGSKESSTGSATTTGSSSSSSSSGSTTTTGSSSNKPSFASAANCKQLESLGSKVAQSVQPNSNGEIDLSKEADALDELANAAPNDIKGDFNTFADAFKNFAKVYGDAKLKIGQTPSADQIAKLTTAAQSLNTPKLQKAMTHLSAWGNSHCGVGSTSP
jgi:hypothetical protein